MNKKIFRVNVTIGDVNSPKNVGNVVVIYDGQCDFCIECIKWVERRAPITAIPFQSADLESYGLTLERCRKEVVVIIDGEIFGGASAVAQLLRFSGYANLATLLRISGSVGQKGYEWIAVNRKSVVIRLIHLVLRRINKRT